MREYISTSEAALKWGIKRRRVTFLCSEGRISGAIQIGQTWAIPWDADKPPDARIKRGKLSNHKEGSEVV